MNEQVELLYTLKELRSLFRTGELCEWDFNCKISAVEQQIAVFEADSDTEEHTQHVQ